MLPGEFSADVDRYLRLTNDAMQVVGGTYREIEGPIAASLAAWAGEELTGVFRKAGDFFRKLGGYPLPQARA